MGREGGEVGEKQSVLHSKVFILSTLEMVLMFERKNLVERGRLLSSNVFIKFSWKCMNNLAYMQASLVLFCFVLLSFCRTHKRYI